jgi:FtsP/CotA-like multicopper oxidase with cupredoxin domain
VYRDDKKTTHRKGANGPRSFGLGAAGLAAGAPTGASEVILDFTDPVIKGMAVFHFHLLSHADKGMMAKIRFK